MPASAEAWCRNPGCALHGLTLDDPHALRCPACHRLLAFEEVPLPGPGARMAQAPEAAEAMA